VSCAYPVFAQNAYQSPREPTGRIVCANCHLAQKPVDVTVPGAVLPDTVFEAVVSVPYDTSVKQVTATGSKGSINVGAVLLMPEGFTLAPKNRLSEETRLKTKGAFVQPYSKEKTNILVVGPVAGDKNGKLREIVFPLLSPDPAQNVGIDFLNYPVYVGGNRGRGQIYPTGEKSNNNAYASVVSGQITSIVAGGGGTTIVTVRTLAGEVSQTIPYGLTLSVEVKDNVKVGQLLTLNPNVGGFGQEETQIVLQSPERIGGLLIFIAGVTLAQTVLIIKKKQFEKVQIFEASF
jgi:apocytochrome f